MPSRRSRPRPPPGSLRGRRKTGRRARRARARGQYTTAALTGEQSLGEFDLIGRLVEAVEEVRRAAGATEASGAGARVLVGSGDDAAVTAPTGVTATSVDAFVEGVHFRRDTAPLESIGRKAMAAALSDLAAMGAAPGEAYVQLGVPPDLDEHDAVELARGLGRTAAEIGRASCRERV